MFNFFSIASILSFQHCKWYSFFINSENTMWNSFNIIWYDFCNIKNEISSEFDAFLSDDEKIAFLISRWITFFHLRLCCLFWLFWLFWSMFASSRWFREFSEHYHTNMLFTILVCILRMPYQAPAWHLLSICLFDDAFLASVNMTKTSPD